MEQLQHPRRRAVLWALVRDYIETREPVASKTLVERHGLGVSSATVRNDLAALEDAGLIYQPHTSAGRVPTERGYREFVNHIGHLQPLAPAQRRAIRAFLTEPMGVTDVMQRTAKLLAQITNHAAVIQYPTKTVQIVRHVELVALGQFRVIAVVITESGDVVQRIVEVGAPFTADDLSALGMALNAELTSHGVEVLGDAVTWLSSSSNRELTSAVIGALALALKPEASTKLAVAGISNLARWGGDFEGLGAIIEALEEHAALLRLFQEYANLGDVHVSIGSENHDAALSEVSVVAAGYGTDGASQLGIIGPTRMDYQTAMSAVRAVASYLSTTMEA